MSDLTEQLRDADSAFYATGATFMKKSHLTHEEIIAYQELTAAEVSSVFFKLGVQKGSQLFWLMLQSYMIVTRAANAGWAFLKQLDDGDSRGMGEAAKSLRSAMHDYAPQHFSPHVADLEFAADCFEQFYDEAAKTSSREEMEELVFTWTERLRNAAKERRVPRASYQDIIDAYQEKKR